MTPEPDLFYHGAATGRPLYSFEDYIFTVELEDGFAVLRDRYALTTIEVNREWTKFPSGMSDYFLGQGWTSLDYSTFQELILKRLEEDRWEHAGTA